MNQFKLATWKGALDLQSNWHFACKPYSTVSLGNSQYLACIWDMFSMFLWDTYLIVLLCVSAIICLLLISSCCTACWHVETVCLYVVYDAKMFGLLLILTTWACFYTCWYICWLVYANLCTGGYQEFKLLERLGEGSKPTAIIGEVADDMNLDMVIMSMEAIHSKHVDANLLAEFIPCPVLLLPLWRRHVSEKPVVLDFRIRDIISVTSLDVCYYPHRSGLQPSDFILCIVDHKRKFYILR